MKLFLIFVMIVFTGCSSQEKEIKPVKMENLLSFLNSLSDEDLSNKFQCDPTGIAGEDAYVGKIPENVSNGDLVSLKTINIDGLVVGFNYYVMLSHEGYIISRNVNGFGEAIKDERLNRLLDKKINDRIYIPKMRTE